MANSIQYDYIIKDGYSRIAGKIKKATDKITAATKKASIQANKLGNNMKKAGDKMASAQNAIAGAGAAIAIKALVSDSMKMEDAMADVAKVSSLTGKSLTDMRFNLEKLSEQVGRPAVGLAQIAFEGKKLGATDKEIIPFVKTVGKMAIAFEIAESEAGNAIGQIRAKLGYGMDDIVRFGDSANELANTMATNGKNIVQITQRMAGTMKTLEFPPGIAAGFAATADMLETSPELAASGMNMMMRKLTLIPGMTSKLMAAPVKTINDVMGKLAKLPVEKRIKKINKMFGAEAGRMVLKMTSNLDLFNKAMKTATDATAVGSMDREMKNYLDRSSTRLKIANEKIRNSFRRLGDALTPFIIMFGNMISRFSKWSVKMSMQHPVLMKIATAVLLLGAAIPVLMIPLGLMISGFGTLLTAITAISLPVVAIVAGIGLVTASFIYWYKSGHPLIKTLKNIGSLVYRLLKPFIFLFKKLNMGSGLLKLIGFHFKMMGYFLNLLLKPIEVVLIAFSSLFDVIEKIINLDFKGALSSYMGAFEKAAAVFGFGGDKTEIESKKVVQSSVDMQSRSKQVIDITGGINVAADKGSKVTSSWSQVALGGNMAEAF